MPKKPTIAEERLRQENARLRQLLRWAQKFVPDDVKKELQKELRDWA